MSDRVLNDRYELLDPIGSGSMGAVYRALDRSTGSEVALKTLLHGDGDELYRLKNEFRSLSDLRHPNLVQLYDLVVSHEHSFVTMELLTGTDLVRYIRGAVPFGGAPSDANIKRLRDLLPQLLFALEKLHDSELLHRDIKPSNLFVTTEGRLVLLDFGLASLQRPHIIDVSGTFVGTFGYMAPELLNGEPPSEAADWYSIGATLFEVLTGALPFEGKGSFMRRESLPTPRPTERAPGVPPDLDRAVVSLLEPDPGRRSGPEALHRILEVQGQSDRRATRTPDVAAHTQFVGRELELVLLRDAYRQSKRGGTVTVRIAGQSGIGKTALVRHFVERTESEDPGGAPLVLPGRCHARESVPFKALDGLVDSLSKYLVALDEDKAAELIPSDAQPLLRLFPVLGRVHAFATHIVPKSESEPESEPEPAEIRRLAFASLLELLTRISEHRNLILWIDDLQWGDLDSARFVRSLSSATQMRALLLLAHRSEEATGSPLLREIETVQHVDVIELAPLPPEATRLLAAGVLGDDESLIEGITRESGGSPFLAFELARLHARRPEIKVPMISNVVGARVSGLDAGALRLLQIVAVAGGPCEYSVATRAADTDPAPAINALRAEGLLRESAGDVAMNLDTYHDRVREVVLEEMAVAELCALHVALAEALEEEPGIDPLRLVQHYEGGGDSLGAGRAASAAARVAFESLAFEQAAALYERAAGFIADGPDRWRLFEGRAEALAQAGRAGEAGTSYNQAADMLTSGEEDTARTLDLRRRAAEQFLRNGHLEEGLAQLVRVLDLVGERMPSNPIEAVARFALGQFWLRLRGYTPAEPTQVGSDLRSRADACWSAGVGLVWFDPLRAMYFHGRHVRLSLDSGDRTHLVRAFCSEAAFQSAVGGRRAARRAEEALERARIVADGIDDPIGVGLTDACAAGSEFFAGRFREGVRMARRAEGILRSCTGSAWELSNAHFFGAYSLSHLGDVTELARTIPGFLDDASDRGDLLALTSLNAGLPTTLPSLATDRPDEVMTRVTTSLANWPGEGFQLPHYYGLASRTVTDLYCTRPGEAWQRMTDEWADLRSAFMLQFEFVGTHLLFLRAMSALALIGDRDALRSSGERESALLRQVQRDTRKINRAHVHVAPAWAALLSAGIDSASGRQDQELISLEVAENKLTEVDLHLASAATRWKRGRLIGGSAGTQLVESAAGEFEASGVVNPERFSAAITPPSRPPS